jgi:hypothetical protein
MSSAIAAIHAGFKQLGIADDADRRALYARVTGKDHLTLMKPVEKEAVVTELRRLGFKPVARRANAQQKLSGKYAKKLQALWIAAWNLGVVRDREDKAMLAFVRRQTGLDHTRFLHYAGDARRAIEGLKGWMTREGGVDWSDTAFMPDYARADGFKIAWAQWLRLGNDVHADSVQRFAASVRSTAGVSIGDCQGEHWQAVMNGLGFLVRAARAGTNG